MSPEKQTVVFVLGADEDHKTTNKGFLSSNNDYWINARGSLEHCQ